jgi:putative GTP pyrophosphokinase
MPPKSYSQLPGHGLSKTKVDVSGERLRKWWFQGPQDALDHDKQLQDAAATLFAFRVLFEYPLTKVTNGLRRFVAAESPSLQAASVGQRLKRAPQIIDKLSRQPNMRLSQMQDIGGARAVLPGGASEVAAVLRRIQKNWEIHHERDLVADPAPTGYRAIHVVVVCDGRLIEVQLRTPNQHAWAEAVEKMDAGMRTELKEGAGPEEGLRLFRLAAEGMALEDSGQVADNALIKKFQQAQRDLQAHFDRLDRED